MNRRAIVGALVACAATAAALVAGVLLDDDEVPSFSEQACALSEEMLTRTVRGHFPGRSGQIAIIPRRPAYMASAAGGWSHSGSWDYLQHVPLVFYGPGVVAPRGENGYPATVADIAPTIARLLKGSIQSDGVPLEDVAEFDPNLIRRDPPRLVVTVVWDGGGWNVLNQWPSAWPNLRRLMAEGISYTNATVGSSPSVTPAVHTTLGTGFFPATHGVTAINMLTEEGELVDAFFNGESSRFIRVAALAERWDEQNGNRALVGMVGYEPWHLGMIGKGAERPGGDRDHAVWLDTSTNEWITNPAHYELPASVAATDGLEGDLRRTDIADGSLDGAWRDNEILNDPSRIEEVPGFIAYHTRALMNLIAEGGYGDDDVTDLLFTNYKQIDRVGHYYNMASDEVRDSVEESDRQLGVLVDFLESEVGSENWVVVVTADHGQEYDDEAINGYGINPREILQDINDEFGSVARKVNPTNIFLVDDALTTLDVTEDEVARFVADYRLADNVTDDGVFTGSFDDSDRLFTMALPSRLLPDFNCDRPRPTD